MQPRRTDRTIPRPLSIKPSLELKKSIEANLSSRTHADPDSRRLLLRFISSECFRRQDVEEDGEEVGHAARQDEDMPDRMVIRQPLPGVEPDPKGIGQAAYQQ